MENAYQIVKNFFADTSLFNLVSFVLALVGIGLAIFFYYKSRRRRTPIYAVRSINLIENSIGKIGDIEISYARSKVENISIARVAFWNAGDETISASDTTPLSPVKISCTGETAFLGVEIVYQKNVANNFRLVPIEDPSDKMMHLQNELLIGFDYFDRNEGIILQIFHTGTTGNEIRIEGVIKGGDSIKRLGSPLFHKLRPSPSFFEKLKLKHRKLLLGIVLLVTPVLVAIAEFFPSPNGESYKVYLLIKYVFIFAMGLLYWSLAFSVLRRRVPKGFDLFDDELGPIPIDSKVSSTKPAIIWNGKPK